MLDYYQLFLGKYSGNTQKHEPTKPTKAPFAPFVGSVLNENPEKSTGSYRERRPDQLSVEKNEIFEERIAIMMYDGGLSEVEAIRYLVANSCYPGTETD